MKQIITILTLFCLSTISLAQDEIVNIPDANFLQVLIDKSVDRNKDRKIQKSEAEFLTGLDVSDKYIYDLTGIEAFTNITVLKCNYNYLTTLNISTLSKLTDLECSVNRLTNLDVSNLSNLWLLKCSNNQLVSLNITNTSKLKTLDCSSNQLKGIDLSNLLNVTYLKCNHNQITNLDLSKLDLTFLYCNNNLLSSLNVTNSNYILTLYCHNNPLSVICINPYQFTSSWSKDFSARWSTTCKPVGLEEKIAEKGLTILKAYNLQGQEVPLNTEGEVIILLYDNGVREKTYVAE